MNRRTFLRAVALSTVGAVVYPRSAFAPGSVEPAQAPVIDTAARITRGDSQWREMMLWETTDPIPKETAPSSFADAFAEEWGEAFVQGIEEGLKVSQPVTLKAQFSTDGVKWIDISGYDASFVINVRNYRVP